MTNKNFDVVCFGEVLWDIVDDRELPGGSPANVAYHLTQLNKKTRIISRVGNDDRGKMLKDVFGERGINTDFFQTDFIHPTGTVLAVQNEEGDMEYDVIENVAWDYIEADAENEKLINDAEFLVYGSLSTRNEDSRNTLFGFLESSIRKIMDINLRFPFYRKEIIEQELRYAELVKMNEEELGIVTEWYHPYDTMEDKMKFIQDKFDIPLLVTTKGAAGALFNAYGEFFDHPGYTVKVADTIGSGDSFLAALLSRLMDTTNIEASLSFACSVGAFVATREGGSPHYTLADIEKFQRN